MAEIREIGGKSTGNLQDRRAAEMGEFACKIRDLQRSEEKKSIRPPRGATESGLAEVAGSDSRSHGSIGCVTTLLEAEVRSERELIEAVRARRCRAGRGLLQNQVAPFDLPA